MEVAALVRRRTLGTVQVPNVLTDAVEAAAAAGSTRSSKLQRRETQHLTDSLKQLSRTPGKGGTTMRLIDANSGGSSGKQYSKRSKKASLLIWLRPTPGKLPVLLCSLLIVPLVLFRASLPSRPCAVCATQCQSVWLPLIWRRPPQTAAAKMRPSGIRQQRTTLGLPLGA